MGINSSFPFVLLYLLAVTFCFKELGRQAVCCYSFFRPVPYQTANRGKEIAEPRLPNSSELSESPSCQPVAHGQWDVSPRPILLGLCVDSLPSAIPSHPVRTLRRHRRPNNTRPPPLYPARRAATKPATWPAKELHPAIRALPTTTGRKPRSPGLGHMSTRSYKPAPSEPAYLPRELLARSRTLDDEPPPLSRDRQAC